MEQNFTRRTLLSAASLLVISPAVAQSKPRIGVIGAGRIGKLQAHAEARPARLDRTMIEIESHPAHEIENPRHRLVQVDEIESQGHRGHGSHRVLDCPQPMPPCAK